MTTRVNLELMTLVSHLEKERKGYAQVMLGMDKATVSIIVSFKPDELARVAADAGVPLFRLNTNDLKTIQDLYLRGHSDRAASLLGACVVGDCGKEGKK